MAIPKEMYGVALSFINPSQDRIVVEEDIKHSKRPLNPIQHRVLQNLFHSLETAQKPEDLWDYGYSLRKKLQTNSTRLSSELRTLSQRGLVAKSPETYQELMKRYSEQSTRGNRIYFSITPAGIEKLFDEETKK